MSAPRPSLASAVLLMLSAVLMFALMDAGLKLLSEHYPPLQVAALRGLSSLPLVTLWVLATVPARSLLRVYWPLHLLRGVLGIAMMGGFVYGLRTMPLSTAYAITFVAPLLVTAMAGPLLKERVGAARWVAIFIGLVGVLVILRPTGEGMLTQGGLAILLAAICYALGAVTVRMLAQRDSTQAMVFWFVVLLSLGAWLLALPAWKPLQPEHGWIIASVGVSGSLAQVALTEAFRRGEASLIAPLEYTALVWGVILDVALWSVLPDGVTWIGAGIIVASGMYLLRREKVHVEAEHP
ncbi:drug/metabolite transporter (DMT)-like permease [Pseudoxanthomonas sp. 3HH-4]|uniref:DMT family transporter n=1 Tax=Pseudoxanthomonas sp. 3HH-4 TaxID=1690214 RepID=UPI00117202A7|nr:DMT family transporter [Pseudoxanthomonas sp. 3HH-4]TQM05732.1 drug/metabolite transporter (DMT)-like permease [Pseudoxanthomonas sp. 3HH-4]